MIVHASSFVARNRSRCATRPKSHASNSRWDDTRGACVARHTCVSAKTVMALTDARHSAERGGLRADIHRHPMHVLCVCHATQLQHTKPHSRPLGRQLQAMRHVTTNTIGHPKTIPSNHKPAMKATRNIDRVFMVFLKSQQQRGVLAMDR